MKHRDAALERVAIWNALIGMAMIPLGIGTAAFTADALTAVQAGDWSACLRAVLLMAAGFKLLGLHPAAPAVKNDLPPFPGEDDHE